MERTWAKLTDEIIEKALEEDLGSGDVTTNSIVPAKLICSAFLFVKILASFPLPIIVE